MKTENVATAKELKKKLADMSFEECINYVKEKVDGASKNPFLPKAFGEYINIFLDALLEKYNAK